MDKVITKQKENNSLIQMIEVQLKEMITRSQSFENFLETNKPKSSSKAD